MTAEPRAPRDERLLSAGLLQATNYQAMSDACDMSLARPMRKQAETIHLLCGHIDALTEQLAAAEVRAVWSREVPTEPGWYWYFCTDPILSHAVPVRLQLIDLDGDGEQLADAEYGDSAEAMGGEWCGPIAMPARATGEEA